MGSKVRARTQIIPGTVIRELMHTTTPGEAVITRLLLGDGLQFDSSTGGENGTGITTISMIPIGDATIPFISGLVTKTTSVIAGTIGTGKCADSTDAFEIDVASSLTFDITVSGVGGLDTGSEAADTWYAVFAIDDSTGTNSPKGLLSLSSMAPTLPTGYDIFRRVGWMRNDASSDFYQMRQDGSGSTRPIRWLEDLTSTLEVISSGGATVFTNIDLAEFVPPTSEVAEVYAASISKDFTVRPDGSTIEFMRIKEGGAFTFGIDCPGQLIEYAGDSPAGDISISVLGYTDDLAV